MRSRHPSPLQHVDPSLPPCTVPSQVDLDCLSDAYRTEQREYYLNTSAWAEVHPVQLLGPGVLLKSYDLNTVTLEELKVGGCLGEEAGPGRQGVCGLGRRVVVGRRRLQQLDGVWCDQQQASPWLCGVCTGTAGCHSRRLVAHTHTQLLLAPV